MTQEAELTPTPDDVARFYPHVAATRTSNYPWLTLALIVAGVLVYWFAESFARGVVPSQAFGSGMRAWDTQSLQQEVVRIRGFGTMLFAAGLVERIVVAIRSLRRAP